MNYSHWKFNRTIGAAFICLFVLMAPASAQGQAVDWHVSEHVVGGTGTGDSWPNAMASLEDALTNPFFQVGDTILVGQGTYHPLLNQSFTILDKMIVVGGYAGWLSNGTLAPDPNQRDVQANQTILSGDLGENDDPFIFDRDYLIDASRLDNAFTVVTVSNVTQGTRIEGFIIEGGNQGTYTGDDATGYRGGGMLIDNSAMDIVNCTFRFNATGVPPDPEDQNDFGVTSDGGGASVRGGQIVANIVQYTRFINCTFHDNFAARGGALALTDGSLTTIPTQVKVVNSLFYDNQTVLISDLVGREPDGNGGAILVYGMGIGPIHFDDFIAKAEITNSTIANNNAANATGGLNVTNIDQDLTTLVQNSVFWGNDEGGTPSTASEITRSGEILYPSKISVPVLRR